MIFLNFGTEKLKSNKKNKDGTMKSLSGVLKVCKIQSGKSRTLKNQSRNSKKKDTQRVIAILEHNKIEHDFLKFFANGIGEFVKRSNRESKSIKSIKLQNLNLKDL